MISVVWGSSKDRALNDYLSRWAARRIWSDGRDFGNCRTMGVIKDNELIAVVVFHNWDEQAGIIEISGASDNKIWLTRPVLNAMFAYAFDDVGCQMVVQRVSEKNKPIQRIFKSFGYDLYYIPRLRGRDEGEYVCTFTAEAWASHKVNRRQ